MDRFIKWRVRENCLDVCDWIDYRPDPHWWPFALIPVLGVVIYALPGQLVKVMLIFTVLASIIAFCFFFVGLAIYVLAGTLADVCFKSWEDVRSARREELVQRSR